MAHEVLRQRRTRSGGGSAPAVRNPGSRRPVSGAPDAQFRESQPRLLAQSTTQPEEAEQLEKCRLEEQQKKAAMEKQQQQEQSQPKRMKTRGAIPEAAPAPPAGTETIWRRGGPGWHPGNQGSGVGPAPRVWSGRTWRERGPVFSKGRQGSGSSRAGLPTCPNHGQVGRKMPQVYPSTPGPQRDGDAVGPARPPHAPNLHLGTRLGAAVAG